MNVNKSLILCGNFNIDLLKASTHKQTPDFLDTLYSRGLYPLITELSRVNTFSATLTDNIFTNVLENSINSGLTSDHLPVFATFNYKLQQKHIDYCHRYKRMWTDDQMNAFRNDLVKQRTDEVNIAYDPFLNYYLALYDKHCPIFLCKT